MAFDWDAEIADDPRPSGRLRWIDGEYVYMFDYVYGNMMREKKEEKTKIEEKKEENREK
jgi:hypothetical protein